MTHGNVRRSLLSTEEERAIVREIAYRAVANTAPEELAVFDDTAADFFDDPASALDPKKRDEAVGFGLEIALLTPYVIEAAIAAVRALGSIVMGAVKGEGEQYTRSLIRSLFHLPDPDGKPTSPAPLPLNPQQAQCVHDVALSRARTLGLAEAQASILADAITGGLVVAP